MSHVTADTPLQVVVLAGGLGTRLSSETGGLPKCMVPVAERPFLEHQIALLRRSGIAEVVLCVGYGADIVVDHFGDGSAHGIRIRYSHDGEGTQLGTGGAVRKALPLLDDEFLVTYADSYLMMDYLAFGRRFLESGLPAMMAVFRNRGKYDRSNLVVEGGLVTHYDRVKRLEGLEYIDFGVSAVRRRALDGLPADGPADLGSLFAALAWEGGLAAFEVDRRFYTVGTPEGLYEFRDLFSGGELPE